MASRQKSFFEQGKKSRPQWHGARRPEHPPRPAEQNPKPPTVIPPIPASSASRSKLKAFQFKKSPVQAKSPPRATAEGDQGAGKETHVSVEDGSAMAASQLMPGPQSMSQPKECPQTPLGRLPLAELIAAVDDNANGSFDLTPGERVLWQYVPGSSQLSSSQPATTSKQGKKRARSTSPLSSSQNETSKHFPSKKQSFDLQTLQKTLKTPQADPAADLWTRYSLKTAGARDGSPTRNDASFIELLRSSSPQTPGSHLKTRELKSLRRSISCANEWPTSAAKRRRLNYGGSQYQALNEQLHENIESAKTSGAKTSRVSLLVEQVQKALLRSRTGDAKAESNMESSPSSDKDSGTDHCQSSPTHGTQNHCNQGSEPQDPILPTIVAARPQVVREDATDLAEKASEFEDDDFDDDELLEAVDASLTPGLPVHDPVDKPGRHPALVHMPVEHLTVSKLSTKAPVIVERATTQGGSKYSTSSTSTFTETKDSNPPPAGGGDYYDDDDDDDDANDMSAADFEDIVAVYDEQKPDVGKQSHEHQARRATVRQPLAELGQPVQSLTRKESHAAQGKAHIIDVSSDDEFGEEADFDDIVAQCTAASQPSSQTLSVGARQRRIIQRYEITKVFEGQHTADNGKTYPQKVLVARPEKSNITKVITLRQTWVSSHCLPNDFVHVVGDFNGNGECIIDDQRNLLIVHPDNLVSATVVGDSFQCIRRAVLQDRVKATSDSSESQIYGHILHEIFQEAMKANRWDDEWLRNTIETIASRYLESFFEINLDPIRAVEQLVEKTIPLQIWAKTFVSARMKPGAVIKDRNGATSVAVVNKLLEVEEKVWSPMYGLKGNVDATVQITTKDGSEERTLTVPFELKTGKRANDAHRAQTALYTLLLSDRYDIDVACGILYYTESSEISRVPAIRHELMHMVMKRNELASYVRQRVELPSMLKSPHLCGNCYAQKPCFIYHKLIEDGNGETSGMKEKFDEVVRHLNPSHAVFLKKWDELLTKEEKDVVKLRRELWTMQSSHREKLGRCFSNVVIEPGSAKDMDDAPKINRYHYSFVKQKTVPGFSFLESQIIIGEPIVISDERGHFALASGYVRAIRKRRIDVAVDRCLNNARNRKERFNSQDHQSFVGIMEVLEEGSTGITRTPEQPQAPTAYRIDKDEFSNGMAMIRNNLISLMDKDVFGSQALRKLIVENAPPTFRSRPGAYSLGSSASLTSLNDDQRNAVEKVLSAKDYALVLGMPGTGKTTTIAHLIRALTAQGKSVLLTSYTHTAVDNILLKIRHDNIGVFRLGALAKIHPDVQDFADLAGTQMKSIEEIKTAYSRSVVATTCLGINHPIFNQKLFDYCIVDEASQITLPVCLGPIRMAKTFVLVGDHNQLPPLVQNEEAREGGLDISLFKMLSDNHPESVVNLETQYRMCEDVMTLSNTLIYNGRLKCGSPAVAHASIRMPRMEALKQHHHTPSSLLSANLNPKTVCLNPTRALCWIRDLLDPSTKACFVNTDPLLPLSRESETGSRIVNTCEATLCSQLVQSLLTTGVPAKDIGVITLYRSQLALIKQNLRHQHPAVEMYTADKFQGRDKEVIILSLVRSNESLNVGELLRDWRRVNVALTRARTKLLILGSKSTLKGNGLLERFVELMDGRGWIYDLPRGAMEGHVFDDGTTQSLTARFSSHEVVKTEKSKAEVRVKEEAGKPKRIDGFFDSTRGKENKAPAKAGKKTEKALLGSRPVLRDIVNDAS
ncbi:MAG: hypothetical protein Q9208_001030 [Pyrenodesmia sp. 3 TL-2023]